MAARKAPIVETCPSAYAIVKGDPSEPVHEQSGRRRIADAHLAQQDRVRWRRNDLGDDLGAKSQCALAFLGSQGRLDHHIARATPHLCVDELGVGRQIAVNSSINDPQVNALRLRQHADRRAPGEKVHDHLHRNHARVGADAMVGDSVIAGEYQSYRLLDRGMQRVEYGAELSGQRLESPQSALRLGQEVQAMVGGGPACFIHCGNGPAA